MNQIPWHQIMSIWFARILRYALILNFDVLPLSWFRIKRPNQIVFWDGWGINVLWRYQTSGTTITGHREKLLAMRASNYDHGVLVEHHSLMSLSSSWFCISSKLDRLEFENGCVVELHGGEYFTLLVEASINVCLIFEWGNRVVDPTRERQNSRLFVFFITSLGPRRIII